MPSLAPPQSSVVVVAAPAGAAPSLVSGRQAGGKNIRPRAWCPRLPGRRIRLQATLSGKVLTMKCKGWCCTGCGPWMKQRFVLVASKEAKRCFRRGRFLTLTLPPEARELEVKERFKLISQVWKRFVQRMGRLPTHYRACKKGQLAPLCREPCGKRHVPVRQPLRAIWVREVHLDGTPHLHVLVDRFIDQRVAAHQWKAAGGGPVVDIKQVKLANVVAYVAKYLAKSLGVRLEGRSTDGLKGIRRYGTTGPPGDRPSLKGVYPVKRGTEPWQMWFKPGLLVPQDWRPVPRGEERHAIAWVTTNFGDARRLSAQQRARIAESMSLRLAAERARRASATVLFEHEDFGSVGMDSLEAMIRAEAEAQGLDVEDMRARGWL